MEIGSLASEDGSCFTKKPAEDGETDAGAAVKVERRLWTGRGTKGRRHGLSLLGLLLVLSLSSKMMKVSVFTFSRDCNQQAEFGVLLTLQQFARVYKQYVDCLRLLTKEDIHSLCSHLLDDLQLQLHPCWWIARSVRVTGSACEASYCYDTQVQRPYNTVTLHGCTLCL